MLLLRPPQPHLRLRVFTALTCVALAISIAAPALASDVTVASPARGARLTSPIWVRAHNVGCEGVPPTVFGYSIDNSSTFVRGKTAYDVDVTGQFLSAGTHTVHFKSWTARGLCPVIDTKFTVAGPYPSAASAASTRATAAITSLGGDIDQTPSAPHTNPVKGSAYIPNAPSSSGAYGIPPYAVPFSDLEANSGWNQSHDAGTPGTSRGSTVYPASTTLYDDARKFYMTYTKRAGERWDLIPGKDPNATHFVLDTYVYLPDPSQVMNLEMDINQVMSNGETVILSTQCAGIDHAWEAGYSSGKHNHWFTSSIKCDPRTWSANTWHHVQIAVHRDDDGVVTHDWVSLDGVYHNWNYTHLCARFIGWQPGTVNIQYQIEGNNKGSGAITTYIHKLTVTRW